MLLGAGAVILALGLAFEGRAIVALGGLCVLSGALGAGWMVSKVIRTPRRWAVPVSAMHLLAGFMWFLVIGGPRGQRLARRDRTQRVPPGLPDDLHRWLDRSSAARRVVVPLADGATRSSRHAPGRLDRDGVRSLRPAGRAQRRRCPDGALGGRMGGHARLAGRDPTRAPGCRDRPREGVGLPGARELGPVRPPRCRRVGPTRGSCRRPLRIPGGPKSNGPYAATNVPVMVVGWMSHRKK